MTDEINKNKTINEGVIKRGGINSQQSSTKRPSSPTGQGGNSNSQNSSNNQNKS